MATEELNVSGSLVHAATEVEVDFVNAVGVEYTEITMTWMGIGTSVAEVIELDPKPHVLERGRLKCRTIP